MKNGSEEMIEETMDRRRRIRKLKKNKVQEIERKKK